jgi:hypothetical protein
MLFSKIRSLANKALVMGALGLAALGSAQATIVVGEWDPAYDPVKFPNLGWRGTIVVDVPPACLALPAGIYSTVSGPCSLSPVLEVKVELYDATLPGIPPTLQTLDFTSVYIYGADAVAIASPGVVAGFDLVLSGQIASTIPEAVIGGEQAIFTLDLDFNSLLTGQEISLKWFTALGQGGSPDDTNKIVPEFTFTVVPEPAGILLTGGALLALGWTRRRRQG